MVESLTFFARLTTQPELRTPKSGGPPVCVFNVVQIDRVEQPRGSGNWADRDPELFLRCTVFKQTLAENIAASNHRPGTRVILHGSLRRERDWQDKEGNTRRGDIEFIADDVAVSHKHVTLTAGPPATQQSPTAQQPASDPWGQQPTQQHNTSQQAPEPAQQPASDPWAASPAGAPSDPWAAG